MLELSCWTQFLWFWTSFFFQIYYALRLLICLFAGLGEFFYHSFSFLNEMRKNTSDRLINNFVNKGFWVMMHWTLTPPLTAHWKWQINLTVCQMHTMVYYCERVSRSIDIQRWCRRTSFLSHFVHAACVYLFISLPSFGGCWSFFFLFVAFPLIGIKGVYN